MADNRPQRTILSKTELGQCLATGATRADIAEYQRDGFTFEEILDLCETAKQAREADKQLDADRQAKAQKRAMKPENEHHPGKSVFAYPEGDVERPRPQFECRTLYAGHKLDHDTSLAREIELVNQVQLPGKYPVEKSDGSIATVEVEIERDHAGKATKKTTTHNRFYRTTTERDDALTKTFRRFDRNPSLIAGHVARFL